MAVVVIYGGGFQPFHQGHLSSYLEAKQAFPNADFYVAASSDVKQRPIPFNDKQFLATEAGVNPNDFPNIVVKNPMNPTEILDRYSPKKDIFILVRSERDPVPYMKKDGTPAYYQPFINLKKCQPFGYHGYVFVTKKHDFNVNGQEVYSGSQVRDMYLNADENGRNEIVSQLYPNSDNLEQVKDVLDKYIGVPFVPPPKEKKIKKATVQKTSVNKNAMKKLQNDPLKENAIDIIRKARPLLKEATLEQKIKFLKLLKEVSFFNIGKKKEDPKLVQHPEDDKTLGYNYLFKPKEKPPEQPKVYAGWEEYQKAKDDGEVEEAKLHFSDPNARINVYYIPPRLHREGKVQNLAHNIPYKALEPFIQALTKKYTNLRPEYIEWHNVATDALSKFGEKLDESQDYLEEK